MKAPRSRDVGISLQRRAFVGGALGLALAPLLSGLHAASPRAPSAAVVDVRMKGAVGDGVRDDTAALQAAIDTLPASGGTVRVPPGRYRVDAARSIRLRSHMHWRMEEGAQLIALPNGLERSYVLLVRDVDDVEISGGRIVGERAGHLGQGGEWGHGIAILGARQVRVHDLQVDDCWGDGICIGTIFGRGAGGGMTVAEDLTIARVQCSGNRRQGLSITSARRVAVVDSRFIGNGGTAPGCGIDVEPGTMRMGAQDVLISGCTTSGNRGSGMQVYGALGGVSGFRLLGNTITDNHGYGLLLAAVRAGVIEHNTVTGNGLAGVLVREGVRDSRIEGNTFGGNSTRQVHAGLQRMARALSGEPAAARGDRNVQLKGATSSVVLRNNTVID